MEDINWDLDYSFADILEATTKKLNTDIAAFKNGEAKTQTYIDFENFVKTKHFAKTKHFVYRHEYGYQKGIKNE